MRPNSILAAASLAALSSCAAWWTTPQPPTLARAHSALDLSSYELHRIGLVPLQGDGLEGARASEMQHALHFELSRRAPFEIVLLTPANLAEIDASRPHESGAYSTRTIIDTARRFRLDGLYVGTVTHFESYAPQALGLSLELVAAETGLVVWSAGVEIDTADAHVRRSIEGYQARRLDESGESAEASTVLLAPSQLMRFAASEVARTLEPPPAAAPVEPP
jgi:hypothetical protein